jgi:hypothetical protein
MAEWPLMLLTLCGVVSVVSAVSFQFSLSQWVEGVQE